MTPEGVTCARLRLAHVTPSGVTSKNPHTLYTITMFIVPDCRGDCQGINQRCHRAHSEGGAQV